MACETTATTGLIQLMGEITTNCYVDIPSIARKVVRKSDTRAKFDLTPTPVQLSPLFMSSLRTLQLGVDTPTSANRAIRNGMTKSEPEIRE